MDLSTTLTLTGTIIVLALVHLYSLRRISVLDTDIHTIKVALHGGASPASAPTSTAGDSSITTTGAILRSALRLDDDEPPPPQVTPSAAPPVEVHGVFLPPEPLHPSHVAVVVVSASAAATTAAPPTVHAEAVQAH